MIDSSAIQALARASSLELLHLAAVVERMMSEPSRILAIRTRLRLGQPVRFLHTSRLGAETTLRDGIVVAMRDTSLTVQEDGTRARRRLPYAAIAMPTADEARAAARDGAAAAAQEPPPDPLRGRDATTSASAIGSASRTGTCRPASAPSCGSTSGPPRYAATATGRAGGCRSG